MNAQEAETAYHAARGLLDARQITVEEYNRRVAELKYQDNTGTWWAISPQDGSWLKWNGTAWVAAFAQASPPVPQAPVPPQVPEQPVLQPAGQPVTQPAAAQPSWYIPPVGAQQKPAASPAAAQPVPQPVQQPAVQPAAAPSYYIPPPAGTAQQPVIQQPVGQQPAPAAVVKPKRNWTGILSLILGIVSWIFYPYLIGIAAIIIGGYSVYSRRKVTGKIAFIAIAGIVIGLASILTDNFYFILFPPSQGTLLAYWLMP
jgi:hypothetical protein